MKQHITIDLQVAIKANNIPSLKEFETWANAALADKLSGEICIRIIDEKESQQLNHTYRQKNHPTNILSFDYQDDETLLGDLAICASVIEKESKKQHIPLMEHWAHITIHGCLHLAGYTHEVDANAETMEAEEDRLLKQLGF